jgi:hypothetical protein
MLLSGEAHSRNRILVTRKNDAEGKPLETLYFEVQELPPEEPAKPVEAGAQST